MSNPPNNREELVIVSVTPQNLERGALWFTEHLEAIKKARLTHIWWQQHTLIIEQDLKIKPFELAERLIELGYERGNMVGGRGLFAMRGGIIDVWPINAETPYLIEFRGNSIEQIHAHSGRTESVKPRPTLTNSIEQLPLGSFVVHQDHGIGMFQGISDSTSPTTGFFVVEYASPGPGREPDRLLVPFNQQERLTVYIGLETPHIHRLGGTLWHSTKRKAKEDAEKLAQQLLELYAKRDKAERPSYSGDTALEQELRDRFGFQETPDQLRCEEELLRDFASTKPMDRVVCGDVGFGKTELAIRAALHVIVSGRQVAFLSPTTILAAQHLKTLEERFKDFPVRVAMLSRITSPYDEKKILAGINNGAIDCVIGTHRLLSKDVAFHNLGLAIIDEEQRFGVKQKERLKEMRGDIDIISLSATPIPRTMQLMLANLRDISLLETPPPNRIPIATFVLPYRQTLIKEAIERELDRGGQCYFLHNRIDTMGMKRERLLRMLNKHTHVRVEIIHGRMNEQEIVAIMDDFRAKKIHVLVATTIIENGLDIASANTLIVDDATRLGLAQAHQLRGRIGRSTEQAYAYFLYRQKHMTETAAQRLEALRAYARLGSGYQIALRDLEIRGAGNILGREQSGTVNKVGLNLYCHMLAESIEWLRKTNRT